MTTAADPKRFSREWCSRIPLMAYRKLRAQQHKHRAERGFVSYAQSGEDIIVAQLLNQLGVAMTSYMDIGANDPILLSNAYYFYRKGCRGVCIEPNPRLFRRLHRIRRRDKCLLAGVSDGTAAEARFYRMSAHTLGTFSREEAAGYERLGYSLVEEIPIPILTPTAVIEQYFSECPVFVSLDAEGVDLAILRAWDFTRYRPAVFCIETSDIAADRKSIVKDQNILRLMQEAGYMLYADTFINSIFVDLKLW